MHCITPDIEQWLLADTEARFTSDLLKTYNVDGIGFSQVVSRWKNIARLLDLAEDFQDIESQSCDVNARDRFAMLLTMWKERNPVTYNVRMLETVLAREVITY